VKRILLIFIVSVVFLGTGCTSTSTKELSSHTYKGELIDVEEKSRKVEREDTDFRLNGEKVRLTRTTYYATPQVSTYQRMQETRYRDTSTSPRLTLILTPLCPAMSIITHILEPPRRAIALGDCLHTFAINEEVEVRTEERPVEDDPVTEKRTIRSSERKPLTGVQVPLLLDGNVVETLEINDRGYASYDLMAIVEENNMHPQDLVHGESLNLQTRYQRLRSTYRISAKTIPEAYFEAQYHKRREELISRNSARHDNCRTIAVDFREFFECYYQRNLM